MKLYRYLLLALAVSSMQSCVKDPLADITDGGWNHERTVLSIKFENQVGNATIENTDAKTGKITVTINVAAMPTLNAVKLNKIGLSYQASSSVAVGGTMNFQNADGNATLTVTSITGDKRDYTIHVNPFLEPLLGTWKINQLTVYGGTGPIYGGAAVFVLADKSWCWSSTDGPQAECDNSLVFTLDSVSVTGNPYGKVVNSAGVDGKYADFIYIGNNPEKPGQSVDVNKFYRQIPKGESRWMRDYAKGTVVFLDAQDKITTGSFVGAGTEDLGNGKSMAIANNAFAFNLTGVDDWGNFGTDYDKFVKRPYRYWVSVTKQ